MVSMIFYAEYSTLIWIIRYDSYLFKVLWSIEHGKTFWIEFSTCWIKFFSNIFSQFCVEWVDCNKKTSSISFKFQQGTHCLFRFTSDFFAQFIKSFDVMLKLQFNPDWTAIYGFVICSADDTTLKVQNKKNSPWTMYFWWFQYSFHLNQLLKIQKRILKGVYQ